jgi:hypothetical protein
MLAFMRNALVQLREHIIANWCILRVIVSQWIVVNHNIRRLKERFVTLNPFKKLLINV